MIKYLETALIVLACGILGYGLVEPGIVKELAKRSYTRARKFPSTKAARYAFGAFCVVAFFGAVFLMTGCRPSQTAFPITAQIACGNDRYWATGQVSLIKDRLYFVSAINGAAVAPKLPCEVRYTE